MDETRKSHKKFMYYAFKNYLYERLSLCIKNFRKFGIDNKIFGGVYFFAPQWRIICHLTSLDKRPPRFSKWL